MNRREFMIGGITGLAMTAMQSSAEQPAKQGETAGSKALRVGLIGTGWYGKVDLFNLIRVAPVNVVSLCDVDRIAVAQAAEMVAARQVSRKTPRTYGDYREMLKEKDLDIVLIGTPDHWHALTMIAAVESGANGIVGDMCVHMFDMTRWMLDLGWPKSVSSSGGIQVDKTSIANISDTQGATFDYDDLQIVWQHRSWGDSADPKYPWGATIYGDKGTLKLAVTGYDFTPLGGATIHVDPKLEPQIDDADKGAHDYEPIVAPAVRGHMRDFLAAIATRGRTVADIEQGHISTASCILANLAMKTGRTLVYDPEKKQIIGDAEANALLRRPYREPWMHPEIPNA